MHVVVLADPDAVAKAAADRFVSVAETAVAERGRVVVVLAGGSTPRRLYALLASPGLRDAVAWDRTTILFGDERCVGPEDPDSNYGMARDTMLDHVPVPPEQVHRMVGEADPERSAEAYEKILRDLYPDDELPRFDLVLLGMGGDVLGDIQRERCFTHRRSSREDDHLAVLQEQTRVLTVRAL